MGGDGSLKRKLVAIFQAVAPAKVSLLELRQFCAEHNGVAVAANVRRLEQEGVIEKVTYGHYRWKQTTEG